MSAEKCATAHFRHASGAFRPGADIFEQRVILGSRFMLQSVWTQFGTVIKHRCRSPSSEEKRQEEGKKAQKEADAENGEEKLRGPREPGAAKRRKKRVRIVR